MARKTKKKRLKTFKIINDWDPNDTFDVEAIDVEEAAFLALEKLGWWVSSKPE